MQKKVSATGLALLLLVLTGTEHAFSSSHREAPYISTDQQADASDLYAFMSPNDPATPANESDTVTFIANYVPLQVGAAGPNFYKFGDDVLYEINIDNDGDALEDISFQFRFQTKVNGTGGLNGLDTFLYNNGPIDSPTAASLQQRQTYSVAVLTGPSFSKTRVGQVIASDLPTAPANVGPKSFPNNSYDAVAKQAVKEISFQGLPMKVFAGPKDDPFFVSLGETFDLINYSLDPANGTAKDDVAKLNVNTIAIQVHKSILQPEGPETVIGVRTTSYRMSRSVLRPGFGLKTGDDTTFTRANTSFGGWVQVSRLDIPLINEVVIPLKDKDRWNGSRPAFDTQFASYVVNPVLAAGMNAIFGSVLQGAGLAQFPATGRNDLVEILLKGVPGLNRPVIGTVTPSSQLRLNMAIAPSSQPNRMGVLGGDTAGFPNGRRLTDDVVDIEIQVVAGLLTTNRGASGAANTVANGFAGTPLTNAHLDLIGALGDGVGQNDKPFLTEFPYLASPHAYR
jgi:hypothetical protein